MITVINTLKFIAQIKETYSSFQYLDPLCEIALDDQYRNY